MVVDGLMVVANAEFFKRPEESEEVSLEQLLIPKLTTTIPITNT